MFGQIPDFNDGLEFLRKLWGNAAGGLPGLQAMAPPMDLDEIDKRIHDLKAVESWLQLNANLVRTTIQGMEVQRATLVALKTFSSALSPEAMQTAMENVARAANAPSASPPRRDPVPELRPRAEPEPEEPDEEAPEPRDEADQRNDEDGGEAPQSATGESPEQNAAMPHDELPPHANVWWDMLQQQFNQVASSAAAASLASLGNLGAFGAPAPATSDTAETSAAPARSQRRGGAAGEANTASTAKPDRTAAKKAPKKASGKTPAKAASKAAGKAAHRSPNLTPDMTQKKAATQRPAHKTATRTKPSPKARDTSRAGRGKPATER